MTDVEIPEEAYERATDAIATLVRSWPASASPPFHPDLGVRGTMRALAIYALEAAALPHLLTAAEVKVLTETASKVAYALGRKDATEEFDQLGATLMEFANNDRTRMRQATDLSMRAVYKNRADGYGDSAEAILRVSREITSQAPQAASDTTSGVPGHQEVSEAVRSPQEPCDDCVEGIAHQHPNGDLVACRSRCPGCIYCPRGEDQE